MVIQHKLPALQRPAQAVFEKLPLDSTDVHVLREELVVVPPFVFCVVHRGVRTPDQGLRILAVVGVDADAYTGGDMQLLLGDSVRCRQRQKHLFRTEGRILRVLDL